MQKQNNSCKITSIFVNNWMAGFDQLFGRYVTDSPTEIIKVACQSGLCMSRCKTKLETLLTRGTDISISLTNRVGHWWAAGAVVTCQAVGSIVCHIQFRAILSFQARCTLRLSFHLPREAGKQKYLVKVKQILNVILSNFFSGNFEIYSENHTSQIQ